MFKCDMCGQCCKNLYLSEFYSDLDRGDGTCKHLFNNLCSIYDNRPLKCRIDECYEKHFKKSLSKDEYYKANYDICKLLKKRGW